MEKIEFEIEDNLMYVLLENTLYLFKNGKLCYTLDTGLTLEQVRSVTDLRALYELSFTFENENLGILIYRKKKGR